MDVAVVVATFGDPEWIELAEDRALPSAREQAPAYHFHGATLAAARNSGLRHLAGRHEYVIHLDADDELEPRYVEALASGVADLRAPAVRYVDRLAGRESPPRVPRVAGHRHDCAPACLPHGNYLVIGTAAPVQLLLAAGGWREYEWSEDWDMWLRCWRRGAAIESVPEATYRAHWRPGSRNRGPDREFRNRVHEEIHRANFPEQYADAV